MYVAGAFRYNVEITVLALRAELSWLRVVAVVITLSFLGLEGQTPGHHPLLLQTRKGQISGRKPLLLRTRRADPLVLLHNFQIMPIVTSSYLVASTH